MALGQAGLSACVEYGGWIFAKGGTHAGARGHLDCRSVVALVRMLEQMSLAHFAFPTLLGVPRMGTDG